MNIWGVCLCWCDELYDVYATCCVHACDKIHLQFTENLMTNFFLPCTQQPHGFARLRFIYNCSNIINSFFFAWSSCDGVISDWNFFCIKNHDHHLAHTHNAQTPILIAYLNSVNRSASSLTLCFFWKVNTIKISAN